MTKIVYKKRNIIMLIPQLGYGGAEKSFVRLANFLSDYHHVTVAVFDDSFGSTYAKDSAEKLSKDINVILLASGKTRLGRWFNRWKDFRILKKESDITISFLSGTNFLNVLTGTKTASIISERGSKIFDPNLKGWKKLLWIKIIDPIIYRFSNKIITVSHGLSSEILENRKFLKDKVVAIEGYINSKEVIEQSNQSIESEFKVLEKYPTIITAGRLSYEKGYFYLIASFQTVKKNIKNAKLIIIGDGPEYENLKNVCQNINLRFGTDINNIENIDVLFTGYKKNPVRYFKIGDLFVFPSLTEGLPNTLIEALASGVPILASDCPWGSKSVLNITDENNTLPTKIYNSYLMPMINTEAGKQIWAEYMTKLLDTPLEKYDEKTSLSHIQRFDINQTGLKWLKIIDELNKQ